VVPLYNGIGLIVDSNGVSEMVDVLFWSDWWVADKALKDKLPRLYSISQNKESLVGDVVVWDGGSRCTNWNLCWQRERFEWEKHLVEQMLTLISNVMWDVRREDRLVWVGEDI